MRNIFTTKELEMGMFIVRNDAGKPFIDLTFARTVAFKICYIVGGGSKRYGIVNFLTDGAFIGLADNKQELVDHLNADKEGYRQMTKDEVIQLTATTEQGF